MHHTAVYRVADRFRAHGEWGLWDAREDSGWPKLDDRFLAGNDGREPIDRSSRSSTPGLTTNECECTLQCKVIPEPRGY